MILLNLNLVKKKSRMNNKKLLKLAQKEVKKLRDLLLVEAEIEVSIEEKEGDEVVRIIKVEFIGEELGYMIGNKGRHLDSMQYILGMMLRNQLGREEAIMVNVDIGGYRQQRVDKIAAMARQKADDARILGESVDMMPMKPADRRAVHMTLSVFDDITTESHGEGRDRFVRIIPTSEADLGVITPTEEDEEESEE
jgi:spoIIIJ-associated protein